jgi:pyruvate/2-oxoglutarate dehydrogenase complex dihydrolipoamide dehydrogenase (E3) component
MVERLRPDICVIGGGSGGLSVAAAAAAFGVPVVLIEKGQMGGDCLNTGCVPSKSLIAAAKRARMIAEAAPFGVSARDIAIDFRRVHDHVHEVIAAIAPNDSKERFTSLGVRVIEGAARFKDGATVIVGDGIEIAARRFVIATGSSPVIPPISGLDATAHFTNETIFDLAVRPEHLIVIGAGPIGLELAQAFRRLGSAVTVLEAAEPLAGEEPECAAIVLDQLTREGIAVRAGLAVTRVTQAEAKVRVVLNSGNGEETIEGSHLLIATGRRPNVEGLGLDEADIAFGDNGIAVYKGLRTSNKRVYAIGDVAGGPQFTHAANYHAGLVIRNVLFRLPVCVDAAAIPRVTFTDPELAHVGFTETEARRRGHVIRVLRWPYRENDRAQAEGETCGHIKVVTSKHGRILGATIVGASAGELITAWGLAIQQKLNIRSLAGMVMPYPTLSEIGKRAALTYFTPGLTSPWVRRIISLLRRFG